MQFALNPEFVCEPTEAAHFVDSFFQTGTVPQQLAGTRGDVPTYVQE